MPEKVENNDDSFDMELTDEKAMINGDAPKGEIILREIFQLLSSIMLCVIVMVCIN